MTYRVAARNDGFRLDRLLVYQPRPGEWEGQDDLHIDKVEPSPTATRIDRATGNALYSWDLRRKPVTGKEVSFLLEFSVTAYETNTVLGPADVTPYRTDTSLFKRYTAAERFIESRDPALIALAHKIAAGETNPLLLARRFYDYVIANATYERTGTGLHGANALLHSGNGECGDYASLFIALSRASGIPARPVVGYWASSGLDQTHVWAESYLEGYGWVPVDPTVGQAQPARRDFYFGSMDNQRVILHKGFNIALRPPTPDNYVAQSLQVPAWWFWGRGDPKGVTVERVSWTVARLP